MQSLFIVYVYPLTTHFYRKELTKECETLRSSSAHKPSSNTVNEVQCAALSEWHNSPQPDLSCVPPPPPSPGQALLEELQVLKSERDRLMEEQRAVRQTAGSLEQENQVL